MENKTTTKFDSLLTGNDIAVLMKCSRNHAYRLIREGKIPHVKVGKLVRVRPSDFYKFIESHLQA